jgi:hypothetical protein
MHKLHHDQRGIAPLLVILILLLLALIGFTGWRVWSASNTDTDSAPAASSPATTDKIETGEEAPPALERISTASDSYSVALPSGWVHATCEDTDILFLAPSEELLGRCNSGSFGAISISRSAGDSRAEGDPRSDPTATDVSVTDVTINRQPATKTSYTVGGDGAMVAVGTRFVSYRVFYEGNTYTLGAQQAPGGTSYATELDAFVRSFRFTE